MNQLCICMDWGLQPGVVFVGGGRLSGVSPSDHCSLFRLDGGQSLD